MKKVLIFILLFSSMKGFCQFPNNLWQGSKFQLTGQLGGVGSELGYQIRTSFADTTAANSYSGGFLKNIAGFTIRTVDDFWSRSNNLQKWNKINGGGSGGSGGGIVSLGNVGNYGLILVNDSTYRVDTILIATRARLMHVADSLLAIIGAKPSGSGTTDYLARWTSSTTLGIGATRDDGSSVGIGIAPSGVSGSISIASRLYIPYYAGSTGGIYVNGLKWGKADVNGNNVIGFNSGSDSATATGNAILGNGTGGRVNGFGNVLLGDEVAPTMAGYDGSLAGSRNIFIGYQAGKFAVKPSHNISIGTGSGQNADSALSNIWIGKGTGAGTRNSVGDVFLGSSINYTGTYNSLGFNSVVGADAFQAPTTARYNSIIGAYAGQGLTTGRENVLGGYNAGASFTDGSQNVSLGAYAAYLQSGSLNVHIGYLADAYNATAYNRKLFINTKGDGGDVALIGGDGNSGQVAINKTIAQIAADAANFQVHGTSHLDSTLIVDWKIGAGVSSPTAFIHPKAGTATAGTAPIKLNTGTALTTPEDGAIEYHGSHIYFTIGSTRYQLDQQVNADSVTTKWSTLGNTLTGTSKFGSLSNHGFNFVTNDVVRGGFTSAGAFSTIQDVIFNGIYFGQGPVNGLSHIRIGDATTLRDITAGSLLNTGIGISALKQNTTGDFNLAVGYTALEKNTTGSDQNAFGRQAGQNNVGDRNLFLGGASGVNCLTCTYQIHVENSNGTGNGVSTGRDNVIIGNRIGNLSPSLHRSIVIADSVDIIFMKDSSGKAYLNAPTIVGSQGEANSTLQSAGSFSAGYVAKTGTYTATINDYTINCTSGTFTVTLPTAVGCAGRLYVITNSGGGTITVGTTSSQTFANVVATPTTLTMAAVGSRTVQSDGANWLLLSSL